MANLSSITAGVTAATALSNLILVTPQQTVGYQPQNSPNQNGTSAQQPPAFLFHYEGEQTVSLQSDITDHYIEDNTAINDQIALRPEEVTTHGYIGELNDIAPVGLQTLLAVADKLTVIGSYTPVLTETAQLAYNTAFQLYQIGANAAAAGVSAWSSINGGNTGTSVISGNDAFPIAIEPNQTKQQVAFQQFYGYWRNRTLFTVQTPWAIFQNMAIKSFRAVQSEETIMITDFEVTFKILRFASTQTTTSSQVAQGRAALQSTAATNLGSQTPVSVAQSLLQQISSNGIGGA